MKIVMLILDGLAELGNRTPLKLANKPNMNELAKKGVCGTFDIGYKGTNKDVNSDMGYLVLLGCYSKDDYPGRGYIESLGAGLRPNPSDICIRGNFATLDSRGNILDRRAGRDETGLQKFAEKLDDIEIDGVRFVIKKSSGHRVSILMKGKKLSDNVTPNDFQKTGVPLPQIKAKKPEAKFTASVLNKFVYKTNKILSKEPINKKRKLPANTILIRNVGESVHVKSFEQRYDLKACSISGLAVTRGVCRFLGIKNIIVPGANGLPNTNITGKIQETRKALKKYDFVFLHINGTDTLSHSRKYKDKRKFIEKVDKELGKLVDSDTYFVVSCDHGSMSDPRYKDYEHLTIPVPFIISGPNIQPDGVDVFDEEHCKKSRLKLRGNDLIEFLVNKKKRFKS
jgi:2,3-bisphosphoglycerate-independent phosphoglycerate mutase